VHKTSVIHLRLDTITLEIDMIICKAIMKTSNYFPFIISQSTLSW